ncbi:S-adenosyl-L-methionine hydrolase (adenosine-forming) [Methylomarinovum caldicuralii]|uniref:S-adenosyl-L-methionine hydrolase (Adenosine-forming) n=1 Tax=Methylomarinovum caldicuralii TaxID=438856 RepID=A0AAU9C157_9GAMM|nr:SAM-dependent chlorinase/fluorinase [Methylomarinovum caldicuralii]BCX82052.1 S-adenosyl-L-methionine hydrolase (adenosine-forming) [Methylomarinovum caldicuralii]
MIVMFTDFGCHGPYLGQMEAVLRREAPGIDVIDLVNDAPRTDPGHSAYLLAALARWWPGGTVFLAVVDPGVGGRRRPVVLEADGKWFVGPDNGLFNPVAVQRGDPVNWFEIVWRPPQLSASFHGRDLFAPVAAALACGKAEGMLRPWEGPDLSAWPADLAEVVYLDHYGNAITGLTFRHDREGKVLRAAGREIPQAGTFSEVPEGAAFWYCNSTGLVEIAVNRGSAAQALGLAIGTPVAWVA